MKDKGEDKKYNTKLLRLMSAYALVMLLVVVTAIATNKSEQSQSQSTDTNPSAQPAQTEYVYVKIEDSTADSTAENELQEKYIVREHMGKIGIFIEDGSLIETIDTYVKTLPEADRRLLGEGIEIIGKQQLSEIIQDYS